MKNMDLLSPQTVLLGSFFLGACASQGASLSDGSSGGSAGGPSSGEPARNVSGVESEIPASLPINSGPISSPVVLHASYAIQAAFESDVRVNGVATGDLDPTVPGDEIVAVDVLGRVHVMTREAEGFRHDMIATTGGELVQVAVGDLVPSIPGDEIVAVGALSGTEDDEGPGIIRIYHRGPVGSTGNEGAASGGWSEMTYLTPSLTHAVAIGPIGADGSTSFVCAGFFQQVLIGTMTGTADTGLGFGVGTLDLPQVGNAKGVAMTDDGSVKGFVMGFDDGHTVEFVYTADGYSHRSPVQHGSPLARVAYDPEVGVLTCDNDGFLRVFPLGDRPSSKILERAKQRLRGAVLVDIDPTNEGLEACSAGYDGFVRIARLNRVEVKQLDLPGQPVSQGWDGDLRYIARDSAKLHHLAAANIDGFGTCLVSCGYSGDVLLIYRQAP